MYQLGKISSNLFEKWHDLVAKNPAGGFHQSKYFLDFRKSIKWLAYQVGLFDSSTGELVGGAMIYLFQMKTESFLYIPQGPIIEYTNKKVCLEQWKLIKEFCIKIHEQHPEYKIKKLRVEPQLPQIPYFIQTPWRKSLKNDIPKSTLVIDLKQGYENIFKNMKQKGRYNIKLAFKKGVEVEWVEKIDNEALAEFFALYKATYQRNAYKGKPLWVFERLVKHCEPVLKLFFATHKGEKLAAALIIQFGKKATYFYGASSNHKKELMAPYLLHSEVIKWAQAQGFEEYDLWGITPADAKKNHPWDGLTEFKLKLGGHREDYIGAYEIDVSSL